MQAQQKGASSLVLENSFSSVNLSKEAILTAASARPASERRGLHQSLSRIITNSSELIQNLPHLICRFIR